MSTERDGSPLSERCLGVQESLEIIRIPMQLPFARTVRLLGTYHGSTLDVSLFFCEEVGQQAVKYM